MLRGMGLGQKERRTSSIHWLEQERTVHLVHPVPGAGGGSGAEFAFDVTTFGMPVSRWGYRFSPTEGGTEVTEYWIDKRNLGATVLGRVFTGKG
jgi:hypothetical protein